MVSKQDIEKTLKLSMLRANDSEMEKMALELSEVLMAFSALSDVSTEGVEPLITPTETKNQWRADQVVSSKEVFKDQVFDQAPDPAGTRFTVPPVV